MIHTVRFAKPRGDGIDAALLNGMDAEGRREYRWRSREHLFGDGLG